MPHAIWSGSISFGLVNVPVKLVSAVAKKDIHFHQLHDADGVRVQLKRVCPADGKEVPYENIVKGYEVSRDSYVVIRQDELDALDPKASRTIDIQTFADLSEIDPIYFEHAYYLIPEEGAAKAYTLLIQAMKNLRKVAIGTVVIRGKQYLAAMRPMGRVLCMNTMLYADEVVPAGQLEQLPTPDIQPDARELAIAEEIINSQVEKLDLRKYEDDHRRRVADLIARKAAGEEVTVQPVAEEEGAKVLDLMAALEASLAARKESQSTTEQPIRKGSRD